MGSHCRLVLNRYPLMVGLRRSVKLILMCVSLPTFVITERFRSRLPDKVILSTPIRYLITN